MLLERLALKKGVIIRIFPKAALLPGLLMETRRFFSGIAGVVKFQDAVENLLASQGADGVAGALAGVVEAMVQARVQQIGPAVSADHRLVDRAVDVAELGDVRVGALRIMDEVVRRRQARLPGQHQPPPERVEAVAELPHLIRNLWKRKGLKHV